MQFHVKNFFDIFDFTSFFAWTFLNFLARCVYVCGIIEDGLGTTMYLGVCVVKKKYFLVFYCNFGTAKCVR